MVSDVTIQTAIEQQSQTSTASAALAEDFTQFLTLLTVQLQNQDPLSPMDTTEFTNQLVAFTQVEQQINSNEKLDSLVALQLSQTMSNAQSYVGNDISYISSEFYFDGSEQTLRYSLPSDADSAVMRIYNEDGGLVYEQKVDTSSGAHDVIWNGQLTGGGIAKDGTYEIQIDALDSEGDAIDATTVVTGMVRGVESQAGAIYLLVGDRAVALSNVLNSSISSDNASLSDSITSSLDYIGMDVTYESSEFLLTDSGTATINYSLDEDATSSRIRIYNDQGVLVFTDDAATKEGAHSYTWDGSDFPAGEYTFEIDAITRATDTIKNQDVTHTIGSDMDISYTLQQGYDSVTIEILDDNGDVIFTDDGDRTNGAHSFTWDGYSDDGEQMPSGDYTVKITGIEEEDTAVGYSSVATGRVTGVEVDNGVVFLQLGSTTLIPLSEIDSVSVPEDTEGDA